MDDEEREVYDYASRICEYVRNGVNEQQLRDDLAQATGLLNKRVVDAFASLYVLRENATHEWEIDGNILLRASWEAMLQLLYILKDPSDRQNRAKLYLDYIWIEMHRVQTRVDKSQTDVGKRVSASPHRGQGERETHKRLRVIGHKYLTQTDRFWRGS